MFDVRCFSINASISSSRNFINFMVIQMVILLSNAVILWSLDFKINFSMFLEYFVVSNATTIDYTINRILDSIFN